MWDKDYSFPMVKIVSKVPLESQIDDYYEAANNTEEFTICQSLFPEPGVSSSHHYKSTAACKQNEIDAVMSEMASDWQVEASSSTEFTACVNSLVKILTSSRASLTKSARGIVDNINTTQNTID
jgi:hypothetical protein